MHTQEMAGACRVCGREGAGAGRTNTTSQSQPAGHAQLLAANAVMPRSGLTYGVQASLHEGLIWRHLSADQRGSCLHQRRQHRLAERLQIMGLPLAESARCACRALLLLLRNVAAHGLDGRVIKCDCRRQLNPKLGADCILELDRPCKRGAHRREQCSAGRVGTRSQPNKGSPSAPCTSHCTPKQPRSFTCMPCLPAYRWSRGRPPSEAGLLGCRSCPAGQPQPPTAGAPQPRQTQLAPGWQRRAPAG